MLQTILSPIKGSRSEQSTFVRKSSDNQLTTHHACFSVILLVHTHNGTWQQLSGKTA
jgi:hypothetical protein